MNTPTEKRAQESQGPISTSPVETVFDRQDFEGFHRIWNQRAEVMNQITKLVARRDALSAQLIKVKAKVPAEMQDQLPM